MNIREIGVDEAELILPLLMHVQSIHAAAQPERYVANASSDNVLTWLRGYLGEENVYALAFEADIGVVGYLLYVLEVRGDNPLIHTEIRLKLDQISVLPEFQRQGVATQLIQEMLTRGRALGVKRSVVSYGTFNQASKAVMQSVGYEPLTVTAECPL
ncbi:MAG: GNAT family N-acetyltransferase [Litoreibacter sp.]